MTTSENCRLPIADLQLTQSKIENPKSQMYIIRFRGCPIKLVRPLGFHLGTADQFPKVFLLSDEAEATVFPDQTAVIKAALEYNLTSADTEAEAIVQ